MKLEAYLKLFVTLLLISYIAFVAAVPATRSSKFYEDNKSDSRKLAQLEDALDLRDSGEQWVDMELEEVEERRMIMEIADYAHTGANRAHDPKSPGKA